MNQRNEAAGPIAQALGEARRVLVCVHKFPDGDALGSGIAAILALEGMGKEAAGYCPGTMLSHFYEIPNARRLEPEIPKGKAFDATLFLDCGGLERVAEGFAAPGRTLNVDHHGSNSMFADLNWVDTQAAAAGQMVFELLEAMKATMTQPIAQALYMAIMADTGSFRYANTSAETLEIAGRLVALGANPSEAARLYWSNVSPESVLLRAEALKAMRLDANGRLAWTLVTAAMYAAHGGMQNEPEGLSSELRGMSGVKIGLAFHEIAGEGIRISLRSAGAVDVAAVARQFGGGGHPNAAGAVFKGAAFEDVRDRVLEAARKAAGEVGK